MKNLLSLFAALGFMLCSCSDGMKMEAPDSERGNNQITIANWNLQTFFDGKKDGCEYKEFQKSAEWNNESYKVRLERLCQFIKQTDADIFVFEEMENENIIYDISNQLSAAGYNWKQNQFWNYSVFAKPEGTAIGIGILSRYELKNVRTHFMDIRIHNTAQPSSRYLLEAQVYAGKGHFTILANHWKSKSGGQEETEIWRDWQESLLGKRLSELLEKENAALIICGDFNRDTQDFASSGDSIFLRYAGFGYTDYCQVKSLWYNQKGNYVSDQGSYFYNDQWERIDNIMLAGKVSKDLFFSDTRGPWASEEGYPVSYKIYSGQGWSDHLPLYARIYID